MSFWDIDGDTVTPQASYVAVTDKEPMPHKTSALVRTEGAEWAGAYTDKSKEYLNLKVHVLKPEGYAGRTEFIKLWVKDLDPSAKDEEKAKAKKKRHLGLLGAIDLAAKGKLSKSTSLTFTDEQLALALIGGQFVCTFGLIEFEKQDGSKGKSNFIMAAAPKDAAVSEGPAKPAPKKPAPMFDEELDDDVPF